MKTIRYISAVLFAAFALSACNKNFLPVSDHPFDISTPKVEATRAVVDVIPDNNDFYYLFGVIDTETYESIGQDNFVNFADAISKSTYKALFDTKSLDKYLEWLYRGAYDEVHHDLEPETRYIAFAFPYRDTIPMTEKFTKVEFNTPAITKSDNTFSVSVDGSVISVTPSNGDSYFFDYCTKEELSDYFMSIDYFFRKTIDIYWEYGFLDSFISKGSDKEDIKAYYPKIADNDVYYMAISGYDKGITTAVTYYKITVRLDGKNKSTAEEIPDFDRATMSSLPFKTKRLNTKTITQ